MSAGAGEPRAQRRRLFAWLWCAGMPGVIAVALTVAPVLAARHGAAGSSVLVSLVSGMQSALLLALAVAAGVRFAPPVGLRAPVFEALAAGQPAGVAWRSQWLPGVIGGLAGGVLLGTLSVGAPAPLAALQGQLPTPLAVRLLYGGVTEELLLRFGVMSLLLWLSWRFVQRGGGPPARAMAAAAIVFSALLFALGHLPVLAASGVRLDAAILSHVLLGNAAFGTIAGFLFWRHGLESAIIAHALAHLLAAAAGH